MVPIRASSERDWTRALEIWRSAVDATHDFLAPEDRIAIDREVVVFLPTAPLWLAVDANDRATGFMLLDGPRVEALFIHTARRSQGIGRALIDYAIARRPVIDTEVNEQNTQAVGFYQRLGFTCTGRSELDRQGRPYPLQLRLIR